MNLRKLIAAAMLAVSVAGFGYNQLPTDPEVRTGTLPNGLTYYLRHNEKPARQADFFIAMRVGSVNEEENQRGLAHFLEHMCFNGTKHFPGNSLIDYLESLGVKFGANLNAYTSTDETVYNICEVPTARQSALDSCLLILRDWSHDLTLDPKEIDAERGVIKGEWRQRNGAASSRLLEKALPQVYPASVYGHRMPIGKMEVVENFKPKELRAYYEKWYHPLNQCVIIVGDIDIDHMEKELKRLWSDVKALKGASAFVLPEIPVNKEPVAAVVTDPEQSATSLSLYIKHPATADSLSNTIVSMREDVVRGMVGSMLAERITEIENADNSPLTATAIGDMRFLLSRGQQALLVRAPLKKGRLTDGASVLAQELKRAARHGFLPTEFERAKIDARSSMEKEYSARIAVTNTDYAKKYVRHYLDGGPLTSAEQTYKMMKGVIRGTRLEDCNEYIRSVVKDDNSNVVLMAYVPPTDKTTPEELSSAYTLVDPSKLEAYVDKAMTGNLLKEEPQAGLVVAEKALPQFGAELWTLSNGIKVYVRPSKDKPDYIGFSAISPGGISGAYDPKKGPQYEVLNDVLAVSASGEYTADDLRRLLAGKNIRVAVGIEKMEEQMGGSSDRANLADAFRLIHLKATDLRPDQKAFERLMARTLTRLTDVSTNPTFAMGDTIHKYVYAGHPLGLKLRKEDIPAISYNDIMALYRDRFSDMSDFSFFFTGDFDRDTLRSLVSRYIASLPAKGRIEKARDIQFRYGTEPDMKQFTMPMENPQSIVYCFYNAPCEFTLANRIQTQILGSVLQNKLREDLRERRGWTYGVKTHIGINAGYNGDDPSLAIMPVYIRVAPENAKATFEIVDSTFRSLEAPENIPAAELAKIKSYMAKNYDSALTANDFWASVMRVYDKWGVDMATEYLSELEKVTPESLAALARQLTAGSRMRLEMAPAK